MDWTTYLLQFGYVGVFLISMISALSIIFPIPYTLILYALGSSLDPILLAISSGSGSAIGEISGYIIGYYGRAIVSDEMKRKMEFMLKIFNHYGWFAIFLFALTPLPDDLLFIPLGMMHYNLLKALIPTFGGKLLMSFIIAYSGRISFDFITVFFGEAGTLLTIMITAGLLIIIFIIMYKIDWEEIFKRYFTSKDNNHPE